MESSPSQKTTDARGSPGAAADAAGDGDVDDDAAARRHAPDHGPAARRARPPAAHHRGRCAQVVGGGRAHGRRVGVRLAPRRAPHARRRSAPQPLADRAVGDGGCGGRARAGERKGEIVCVQAQADGGIGGEQLTPPGCGRHGGGGDVVDVVTAEALSARVARPRGRGGRAGRFGRRVGARAAAVALEARKRELLKACTGGRRRRRRSGGGRWASTTRSPPPPSAAPSSCWSVRHHWVEFDWREKVLVGLVLVASRARRCSRCCCSSLARHVPECASEAGAVDGVVGRARRRCSARSS